MGDDEYVCEVSVDGNLAFTQNFKFNGIAELRNITKKFKFNNNVDMKTVETSLVGTSFMVCAISEIVLEPIWTNSYFKSRIPGQSFAYKFKDLAGAVMKIETVSFQGPSRMVWEEIANEVAMMTVFEKQWFIAHEIDFSKQIFLLTWNLEINKKTSQPFSFVWNFEMLRSGI